jgi:hypothetical protein
MTRPVVLAAVVGVCATVAAWVILLAAGPAQAQLFPPPTNPLPSPTIPPATVPPAPPTIRVAPVVTLPTGTTPVTSSAGRPSRSTTTPTAAPTTVPTTTTTTVPTTTTIVGGAGPQQPTPVDVGPTIDLPQFALIGMAGFTLAVVLGGLAVMLGNWARAGLGRR